jgi:hypothetical protein
MSLIIIIRIFSNINMKNFLLEISENLKLKLKLNQELKLSKNQYITQKENELNAYKNRSEYKNYYDKYNNWKKELSFLIDTKKLKIIYLEELKEQKFEESEPREKLKNSVAKYSTEVIINDLNNQIKHREESLDIYYSTSPKDDHIMYCIESDLKNFENQKEKIQFIITDTEKEILFVESLLKPILEKEELYNLKLLETYNNLKSEYYYNNNWEN